MQNNKEILKYITSSIWSAWNPWKWPLSMKLAAASYTFSCLIEGSAADQDEINNELGQLTDDQLFTFRVTQFSPSHYMELAKEIPICLKRLKIFNKFDDNYVPDEAIASHKSINNFSNLLEHFNLTTLTGPSDSDPYYFIIWSWTKNLGDILKPFGQKLQHTCNNIEKAENYWENYQPEAFDNSSMFHNFISTITHCNTALLGCSKITKDIYYDALDSL